MKNSSEKDFTVYDFTEDDEDIELSSNNMLRKYGSGIPKSDDNPLTKYQFLEFFSGSNAQQTEITDVLCVDYDTSDGGEKCNIRGSHTTGTSEREFARHEESSGLNVIPVTTSTNYDEHSHISEENFERGNFSPGCLRMGSLAMGSLSLGVTAMAHTQLDRTSSDLASTRGPVDLISDEDDSFGTSSPSTPTSDLSDNEAHCVNSSVAMYHASSNYSSGKMENIDMVVIVSPDFVTYGTIMCKESQLAFSSDRIKLQCTNASGSNTNFGSEWEIVDVVHIECRWSDNVETAWVKILLREPTAIIGTESVQDASGILKLMFVVSDPRWSEKEQKIISLGERYKTLWNVKLDVEMESEDDDFMENNMSYSKHYLTYFEEPFEDVIYPKGDPDAVSISKRDIKLLQPETFINDTIIDFYIKYLKNELRPEDIHRFHFFNSFFFRKLVDLDKDPGRASEGRVDFQRVRKWTRKVNIFEKDYIFIPVNFSLHWSLIVICHPGEVAYFKDEEIEKALRVPCILHMDSIKGNHKDLKNLVQSYLWEEWKERHKELSEDFSSKFSNLRFVPLELPQQENSFDCGLFLLHYVELFLAEAPVNFNPFRITKLSNFLNVDWFPPAEASHKRSRIQMLICKLPREDSEKNHQASCSNGHHSSEFPENGTANEPAVEFLTERCSPPKMCIANSPPGLSCNKEAELGFREMFETGANSGFGFHEGRYQPFSRMTSFSHLDLSPVKEEGEDADEHFGPPTFGKLDIKRQDGITTEFCTTSYSVKDITEFKSPWVPDLQMKLEQEDGDSLSGTSSGDSHDLSEVEVNELVIDSVGPNQQEDIDKLRSVTLENCGYVSESPDLAPNEKLLTCAIEDCQEADTTVPGSDEKIAESPNLVPNEKPTTCVSEYSQEADTTVPERNEEVAESPDLVAIEKLNTCEDTDIIFSERNEEVAESPDLVPSEKPRMRVVDDYQEAETTASGSNDGHEISFFSSQENLSESTEKDDVHLIGDDLEMNIEKHPDTTAAEINEGREKLFLSSQENLPEPTEKDDHSGDDVQLIGDDSGTNVGKRAPKRRKVYSGHEGERRQTRSLSR